MPTRNAVVAPAVRHRLQRGVHSIPYGEGRCYFYVTSVGKEGYYRFREEWETEDQVVISLGDELDRIDPRPRASSQYAPPHVRVLRLHRV